MLKLESWRAIDRKLELRLDFHLWRARAGELDRECDMILVVLTIEEGATALST